MAVSQFRLPNSKRSPSPSSSQLNGRKLLETKRKLLPKKASGLNKTTAKKVISAIVKKSIGETTRPLIHNCHDIVQNNSSPMQRAQEVQANLQAEYPSFTKLMLPSHVTGGFWLSFPKPFCDLHLPKHDDTVVLVDDCKEEYKTKYLVDKNGLSGGWRGFSIAHKLLEGDVLVFQLIQPCKFKVYIVRANGLTELDGAIGLLTLDASLGLAMEIDQTEMDVKICGKEEETCLKPLPLDNNLDKIQETGVVVWNTDSGPAAEQSGNESDDFGSEVLEGIRFSESVVDFKDVKSIENFTILVDGLIIDSEVPPHLRIKYYQLCCSQKAFLHDHLLEGLNCKLAAGIISETVNIADAIKACKLTTSRANFSTWDKTLKSFQELGMNVGFLRTRLDRLVSLALESEEVLESKRREQLQAEEDVKTLEAKILEVKEVIKNLDAEVKFLQATGKTMEVMFQKEANAPW